MNRIIPASVLVLGLLGAGAASASDNCTVPMAEWQPKEALQQKLEAEGWKIRQIKVDDGCYEAYAVNQQGQRLEAYYNPKTFELVKQGDKD